MNSQVLKSQMLRDAEYAKVDRWFAQTPRGLIYHALDKRAFAVSPAEAERLTAQARMRIDAMVLAEIINGYIGAGIFMSVPFFLWLLRGLVGMTFNEAIGIGLVLGFAGVRIFAMMVARDYKADLKALRAAHEKLMVGRIPIAAEQAAQWRQTNPWRTAMEIVVMACIGAVALMFTMDMESAGMRWLVFGVMILFPIAWGLHFAAAKVDEKQSRSRMPPVDEAPVVFESRPSTMPGPMQTAGFGRNLRA